MTKIFSRRRGAYFAAAFGVAGLMTSTPGQAVISHDLGTAPVATLTTDFSSPALKPVILPPVIEAEADVEHLGDGEASYYGKELAGNRTANGERFNPQALTAAHRTLPMGTKLKVTNKANGKSVIVRINDRGPFVKKRLIDVSLAAAHQINMVRSGHAMVRLERLR